MDTIKTGSISVMIKEMSSFQKLVLYTKNSVHGVHSVYTKATFGTGESVCLFQSVLIRELPQKQNYLHNREVTLYIL